MQTNKPLTYSELVDIQLILGHELLTLNNSNKILKNHHDIVVMNNKQIKKVKVLQAKIGNLLEVYYA
jgi:hypothetical protein